ncbi:MAG: response regulator transcription factor, partial [Planctomycetaceae bacterium]|nr:response regulator transcription factor [Planctomycetaceae bacterium]
CQLEATLPMQPIVKRYKVLIIDDDPLFRSLLVSLLRKDYLVSVASDGADGFYKAVEYPPDIAIVDIQMPQWDGIQTLKAFRGHSALQNTKVIMLTSDASRETVLSAIKGGANDYVIKTSFSKEELRQKIHRLVTKREQERLGLPRFTDQQKQVSPVTPSNTSYEAQPSAKTKTTVVFSQAEVQVAAKPIMATQEVDAEGKVRESTMPVATMEVDFDGDFEEYNSDLQGIIDDWE